MTLAEQNWGRCVIALDVGGSSIKSGIVDLGLLKVLEGGMTTRVEHDAALPDLLALFERVIRWHITGLKKVKPVGVSIAFPAPFDYEHGISQMEHKFAALKGFDLQNWVRKLLPPRTPIAFLNDAEAAVLGECYFGTGEKLQRVVGITLGTGLGACFIANGQVQRQGAEVPTGGELYDRPYRDSIADDYFSHRGLLARLQATDPLADDISFAAALAHAGNQPVRQAFHDFGRDLGLFLQPYITSFQPQILVVMGGLSGSFDFFSAGLRQEVHLPVEIGRLGTAAPLLGGSTLFFKKPWFN